MEKMNKPYKPIRPGEILKEELDARCWTQGDFAEITGKPLQAINEILAGKKAITPETALLFSKALGTTPEFWLNLESAYRLDMLHHEQHNSDHVVRRAKLYSIAPVKELAKRHWIKPSKNIDKLEAEVLNYFGIFSLEEQPKIAVNFRKSEGGLIDTPSLLAWVRKTEIEAKKIKCPAYEAQKLRKAVQDLPALSVDEPAVAKIPQILCNLGIRLVFVPHLPQTRVDGAAFWLDKSSPVVALSLRMDRIDNFWFTLMHELVHVMEGARTSGSYLDQDIINDPGNEMERKINQKARDFLIPPDRFNAFVTRTKPFFSRSAVLAFAKELGIHPSIVVGRLHHEEMLPYTHLRNLMGKVRPMFAGHMSS